MTAPILVIDEGDGWWTAIRLDLDVSAQARDPEHLRTALARELRARRAQERRSRKLNGMWRYPMAPSADVYHEAWRGADRHLPWWPGARVVDGATVADADVEAA